MDSRGKIEELLQKMTLEEKLHLTTGDGLWRTMAYPQFGIPSITMSDGTNGLRFQKEQDAGESAGFIDGSAGFDSEEALQKTHKATCFPSGSTISCSWDRGLLKETAYAIADQCRALGISLLLGPGVNIRRHPLTARNFEYYSEDPCLSGEMGAAMVTGLWKKEIGSCPKHFVCHNSDDYRTRVDCVIDERALREIYLASFERVVRKGRPVAIMTAYNKINGVFASENSHLLKDVLKEEWKFDGAVISDWGGVSHPKAMALGGLDLHMPESLSTYKELLEAYRKAELPLESLNDRVRRLLSIAFDLDSDRAGHSAKPDFASHHELARQASLKSSVLLKNEGKTLPIQDQYKTICVLGTLAKTPLYQGTGCAIINAFSVDSPLEEIEALAGNRITISYAPGYTHSAVPDTALIEEAVEMAKTADAVIIFLGCYLPAESDTYNRKDISVEASHLAVLEAIKHCGKKIIAILNSGDVVEMPWIGHVDALLYTGFGGEGYGKALAKLLFGETSPSGKLPVTIPNTLREHPAMTTVPGDKYHQHYGESVFVGYRYYDYKDISPLFPFGFGLSYTEFRYENLRLSKQTLDSSKGSLTVGLSVTNCGTCPGDEIVQLYVAQKNPALQRPPRELKDFARLSLNPGESKELEFSLSFRDFAYFDPFTGSWKVDSDDFEIQIGASSRDIRACQTLRVKGASHFIYRYTTESGFTEVFAHPEAERVLFEFLLKEGLISEDESRTEIRSKLIHSFWGLYAYFDMNSRGTVSFDKVQDLVDEMNRAIQEGNR